METALATANFFVQKSQDTGVELSPMKLVKLVYLAHGWYLGIKGTPLIPESVQAWKYGPVVPSIYFTFKKYGDGQITQTEIDCGTMKFPTVTDNDTKAFMEVIWDVYGKTHTGLQLSTLTHEKGSPWDITWNEKGEKNIKSVIIPNDIIKEYYQNRIKSVEDVKTPEHAN